MKPSLHCTIWRKKATFLEDDEEDTDIETHSGIFHDLDSLHSKNDHEET